MEVTIADLAYTTQLHLQLFVDLNGVIELVFVAVLTR
jgi:hypothetical protein